MSITLAEPLEKWVREQAEAQGLKDADAYVNQLVREDQKRKAVEKLVKNLEDSEASGFEQWTANSLKQSKQRLQARHTKVKA